MIVEILKAFKKQGSLITKAFLNSKKDDDEGIDWDKIFEVMFVPFIALYKDAGEAGNTMVNNVFFPKGRIKFETIWEDHLKWINKYGSKQIKYVTDTTKDIVKGVMIECMAERLPTKVTAKRILEKIEDLAPYRARNIARTETHNAIGNVTHLNYIAQGFKRHKWMTCGDEVVRHTHQAINNQEVEIGEKFGNGLRYPGDTTGRAGEIVNCRCWSIPTE